MTGSRPSAGIYHRHGDTTAADVGMPVSEKKGLLDFSVSLNPLGVPDVIRDAWPDLLASIQRYPTPDGRGIAQYYGQKYGIDASSVVPGNGSVELMYRCFAALRFKRVAVICPSFYDYENAVRTSGAQVERVYLNVDDGFRAPTLQRLNAALDRNDAIVIGNPNNPTGTLFERGLLHTLANNHPGKTLLVDEAFLPFVDDELSFSLMPSVTSSANIIVFHSLTKIFAIPGIRVGAIVAAPQTVARIRNVSPPWMCNSIAECVAPMLLQCENYIQETRALVFREMSILDDAVGRLKRFSLIRGAANFALVQLCDGMNLDWVLRHLFNAGILVRDCRNFEGLSKSSFRFAIRLSDDNQKLFAALQRMDNG